MILKNRHKALFLDRDGVINVDTGYVYKISDFIFVDGIFEVCSFFQDLNYLLVVVSNQSGIGRGLFGENDLNQVDDWMKKQFMNKGIPIERTYYCPYIQGGKPGYEDLIPDRKPAPGMIFKARDELNIDLKKSILIGDKPSDIQAALSAGVGKCIYLKSRYSNQAKGADSIVSHLLEIPSLPWVKQLNISES